MRGGYGTDRLLEWEGYICKPRSRGCAGRGRVVRRVLDWVGEIEESVWARGWDSTARWRGGG